MSKILVPVDGSHNCLFAVRHVIAQFMNDTTLEIHLLNVQPPLSRHIASHSTRKDLREYHRREAEKALRPARKLLDRFGIPHSVHSVVGETAKCITDEARRLRCAQIVMSTARKNSLTRLLGSSVTDKVIQLTQIPVDVIAGDQVSNWERYGIPAAIAALLALFMAAAD